VLAPALQERLAKTNYFAVDVVVIHSIGEIFDQQVFRFIDKDSFRDLADCQGP
jgi:hypothetical protein